MTAALPFQETAAWRDPFLWAALLAGLAYRLCFVGLPLWGDEAATFLYFAKSPWRDIVTDYASPNNHILHSLLMHGSYRLFGISEFSLRLPAFLFGVLAIPLTYLFAAAAFGGRGIARLACVLTAASHAMASYSVTARGYSIQAALGLLLGWCAFSPSLRRSRGLFVALLSGLAFLHLYTVPSGVLFVLPFFIFMIVSPSEAPSSTERRDAAAALALAGGLFLLATAGFWKDFSAIAAGQGVELARPLTAHFGGILSQMTSGVMAAPAAALAVAAAGFARGAGRERALLFLALATGLYPLAVLALDGWFPFLKFYPRNYVCLFPFVYVLMARGLMAVPGAAWPRAARLGWAAAAGLLLVSAPFTSRSAELAPVSFARDPQAALKTETRAVVRALAPGLRPGDRINGLAECDGVAAIYTVQKMGFNRFYGLGGLEQDRVARVFLVGQSAAQIGAFHGAHFDAGAWSPPALAAAYGSIIAMKTERVSRPGHL